MTDRPDEPDPTPAEATDGTATDGTATDGTATDGTATEGDETDGDEPTVAPRPLRLPVFAVVAALALTLDVVSKALIVAHYEGRDSVRLLGGVVWISVTRNSGAAFSLGTGFTIVLTVVALAVVVVIARVARRLRSVAWAIALGLVLGGALGNLVDRIVRAPGPGRGHVVDWISVFGPEGRYYPIFNLADSAIVCGGVLAVLTVLRGIEFDGTRGSRKESRDSRDSRDARPRGTRHRG